MSRNTKRTVIIAIYLTIFSGIGWFLWNMLQAPASCSDGKKNQNEQGIDCGGVCVSCPDVIEAKPFEIKSVSMVTGGQGRYDVIVEIKNPNSIYGAKKIPYVIVLRDAEGIEIERVENESFALPSQSRYIAELNIPSNTVPARAEAIINSKEIQWVKFVDYEDPNFVVSGERFGTVESGINYAQAFGIVNNRSTFDFQDVGVIVILKNEKNKPIAVNKTVMRDLIAYRQRDFSLSWPYRFPGKITTMEVEVEANVYDSENFIKKYAPSSTGSR